MPKETTAKYYAVLHGRDGPAVYDDLPRYRAATLGFSAASSKSFFTYDDALQWLLNAAAHRQETNEASSSSCAQNSPPRRVTYVDAAVQYSPPRLLRAVSPRAASQPAAPSRNPLPIDSSQPVKLSQEQENVLNMVLGGASIFFTGPAGTGKSVLLREIIKRLRARSSGHTAVTATTGIAALNIGGSTIHSFAGIGLGKLPADDLVKRIRRNKYVKKRWRSTRVLIIDEVSMMDGRLFDKLEFIARNVRRRRTNQFGDSDSDSDEENQRIGDFEGDKPFGGIQLVISGDFFQLPPVPDKDGKAIILSRYAFQAVTWSKCITKTIFLTQVFRQRDDTFINLLGAMRSGKLAAGHVSQIRKLQRSVVYDDGIEPSELFPLRRQVVHCNEARLKALNFPMYAYRGMDSSGHDARRRPVSFETAKRLLEDLIAPEILEVKVGAQVMLLVNVEQGTLVNGSVGKIINFTTLKEAQAQNIPIIEVRVPENDPELPLTPITTHIFPSNQAWPVVEFPGGRPLLCPALCFEVIGYRGQLEARRFQVPLVLAWALSIHKSQGQTLQRVRVDLGKIFEKGQAYVALSRATTLEHLQVLNFDPAKVRADPEVLEWQDYWNTYGGPDLEMDSEEAISSYFDGSED